MRSKFAQAFSKIRREAGLTQKQFAALAGVSPSTITSLESRNVKVTEDVLDRICEVTGASIAGMKAGREETYDGFPYTKEFFQEYASGKRNGIAPKMMVEALKFDLGKIMQQAESDGLLIPTILRLANDLKEMSDLAGFTAKIVDSLKNFAEEVSPNSKGFASLKFAGHVPYSSFTFIGEGKLPIARFDKSRAFGYVPTLFETSLTSKAPYWPYEVEPHELSQGELKKWLGTLKKEEEDWFTRNYPGLTENTSKVKRNSRKRK